ncbi:response regulator (plasmid) [Roseomonas sp. CCTCC AB2023176]|uniref:response regulator n=1 Tax=Roseomonas sp. CCTCC AB2023176 TaxID=3342640 RepID=UPI0035DA6C07
MGSNVQQLRPNLFGCRILIVEDEFFIAADLADALLELGAEVVGPIPTLAQAVEALCGARLDGAVLDVNLHGEMVWPVVEELLARDVPITLATGYTGEVIPPAYAHLPVVEKPCSAWELSRIVAARAAVGQGFSP